MKNAVYSRNELNEIRNMGNKKNTNNIYCHTSISFLH